MRYEDVYQAILGAIYQTQNAKTEKEKASLIQELRQPARQLWRRYQNQQVEVDYSDAKTQSAYLLRYFLPYSRLLHSALESLSNHKFGKHISACFVGAGPCPEVVSLISYLTATQQKSTEISVHLVDKDAAQWKFSRDIVFGRLLPILGVGKLKTRTEQLLDITSSEKPSGKFDLVVFQNCLNEVLGNNRFDVEKLKRWSTTLAKDGLLVLIDRPGYPAIETFLGSLEDELHSEGLIKILLPGGRRFSAREIYRSMPADIKNRLLYFADGQFIEMTAEHDGLMLKNDWDYVAAGFKKIT